MHQTCPHHPRNPKYLMKREKKKKAFVSVIRLHFGVLGIRTMARAFIIKVKKKKKRQEKKKKAHKPPINLKHPKFRHVSLIRAMASRTAPVRHRPSAPQREGSGTAPRPDPSPPSPAPPPPQQGRGRGTLRAPLPSRPTVALPS